MTDAREHDGVHFGEGARVQAGADRPASVQRNREADHLGVDGRGDEQKGEDQRMGARYPVSRRACLMQMDQPAGRLPEWSASVSSSSAGTSTPLPAAKPSSFTTTGLPNSRHQAIAPSASSSSNRS